MKKQDYPQKEEFFDLLTLAVRKGEKVSRGTKTYKKKSGGCSSFGLKRHFFV